MNNLEKPLTEIARVVDPSSGDSRILLLQAAPDNEVFGLTNRILPHSAQGLKRSAMPATYSDMPFSEAYFKRGENLGE